jgi:hypothetical protein
MDVAQRLLEYRWNIFHPYSACFFSVLLEYDSNRNTIMIRNYFRFWMILGAFTWPALTIYNLFQPYSENNVFQIVYRDIGYFERAVWLYTTPFQGAILGAIVGCFVAGIIMVELWSNIAKPILKKLGIG